MTLDLTPELIGSWGVVSSAPNSPEPEASDEHEAAVVAELRRQRVYRDARDRLMAERQVPLDPIYLTPLPTFLATPDPDVLYRVGELLPVGGNAVVWAQYKAGKTTLLGNLVRSLVDGSPFLGSYEVDRSKAVAILDFELDARTLRRWLRELGIANPEGVRVMSLRGRVSAFDIRDPEVRAAWAAALAGVDVLIVDPLRPILDALGLDENREVGKFLVPLDALKLDAGISELVVAHHAGHSSERSRGDSRLRDWPDAEWRLVRESEDPASPRYFGAFGRDVDVPESRLEFDLATRGLTLLGGSRADSAEDAALTAILGLLVQSTECLNATAIETALADEYPRAVIRGAMKRGRRDGSLTVTKGKQRALLHCAGRKP